MNKKVDLYLILSTIICLIPSILGIALYSSLPEKVAIHFNLSGEADGYSSKIFACFGLPLIFVFTNFITHYFINMDIRNKGIPKKMIFFSKLIAPLMSIILVPLILFNSIGYDFSILMILSSAHGFLFIFIGYYLPKTKQNSTVGVRLTWTLNSEENWVKTHKLTGALWMLGGLIIVLLSLLSYYSIISFITVFIVIFPIVYSFYLYKKEIKD